MAGVTYYVTLPGMKKEPITISDQATVADFCREVFHRTGCTIFNGFGFVGQGATTYYTPRLGVVVKLNAEKRNAAGAIQTKPDLSNVQVDSRRGTETLFSSLASSGDELIIFNVPLGE